MKFKDKRRYARNIEITGATHTARFDTSLPFENGILTDFCWLWIGGKFRYKGIEANPAKFAYQWLVAELTENQTVIRSCQSANCVNPYHAKVVGYTVPTKRARCRKNHTYNLETIYTYPNGRYECKLCRRSRWARYAQKTKKQNEKP